MPGILCEHCTAVCCKYVALPIDTPTTLEELDYIRWYLIHEEISVFVEDGDWYISFQTGCRHLLPDNRCGIYETRPQICRDYTTDNCDYHSGDYGWEYHFTTPEHLDEFRRLHFRPTKKKGGRRRKPLGTRPKAKGLRRNAAAAPAERDLRGIPLPILPGIGH